MAQVIALLLRVLGILTPLLSYIQTILGFAQTSAQEHAPYAIETIASNAANTVNSPTFGNAALLAAMASLQADIDSATTALLAAIGTPQQAGSQVTLPTTPPTGYGADPSEVAGYVWGYSLPGSGKTAGDQQDNAGNFANNLGTINAGFINGGAPFFYIAGTWWDNNGPPTASEYPHADPSTIVGDDTLVTWLERESGYSSWTYDQDAYAQTDASGSPDGWIFKTVLNEAQFQLMKSGGGTVTVTGIAPVWPGFANVTLGTPVALASTIDVVGPMDGVLIEITAWDAGTTLFDFGVDQSLRYIGALAFYSDHGEVELPQTLGFTVAIYCPKNMTRAAGCEVRTGHGLVGTVTPWTINP